MYVTLDQVHNKTEIKKQRAWCWGEKICFRKKTGLWQLSLKRGGKGTL